MSSNFTIPPTARLDLDFDGAPINPVQLAMAASAVCTVNGTLNVSTASVTGTATSSFTLSAGGTLMTARDDGINGSGVGNGSVQGFAPANITYNIGANYVLKTMPNADVPMNTGNAGGTKPDILTMNNLTIWGSSTFLNRARNFPPSLTVNGTCTLNGRAVVSVGSTLTLNGATSVNNTEFWIAGTVTLGAAATLNVAGNYFNQTTLSLIDGGTITGGTPPCATYSSDAYLVFGGSWSGTTNDAYFPQAMGGNVGAGGTSVTLNNSKTIAGTLAVHATLNCGTGGLTHSVAGMTTLNPGSFVNLNGQSLTLGAVTGSGGMFRGSIASNLTLNGTFTGASGFLMQGGFQQLNNLTVNLGGANSMTLGAATLPQIFGTLTLTSGRVITGANTLTVENTATNAIQGGNANAFVEGQLLRRLPFGIMTDGSHYGFPVGAGAMYRPITFRNIRTGAASELLGVLFSASGAASGTAPLTVIHPQNWRVWTLMTNGFQSATLEADATGIPTDYGLGMVSMNQAGPYMSILATVSGSPRQSAVQAALAPIGTGIPNARYFAFGLVGASITDVRPRTIDSGAVVSILGSNLSQVSAIAFGGEVGTLLTVSDTLITARVGGSGASGFVTLVSPSGVTSSSPISLQYTALPLITNFTPSTGSTNSTITITGRRFGSVQAVFFGGVPALSAQVINSSEIRAVVGNGASGLVSMTSFYGTTTATQTFTFDRRPFITSFTPEFARPQDTVRILGAHFQSTSKIFLGTKELRRFSIISPTEVRVVIDEPFSSGVITLENAVGTAATVRVLTYAPPPTITSVPAISGVEQEVVIRGTDFIGLPSVSILENAINTSAASVVVVSPTELRVVFTSATVGPLTVQTYGGAATTASVVTIVGRPLIIALSPNSLLPNERITVTGANFTNIQAVMLGGVAVPYTILSPTQLAITAPTFPVNLTGAVMVRTLGGVTTSSQTVRVIAPPTITSLQPSVVQTGSTLTIHGTNLRNIRAVRIAGVTAQFTADASASRVTTIVPVSTTLGNVSVIVQTEDGTADGTLTLVLPPTPTPVITGFAPNPLREGDILTISGANFPVGTSVTISLGGLTTATVQVTSSSQLAFRIPSPLLGLQQVSTRAFISLASSFGTTSAQIQITLSANAVPTFTDFSPKRGTSTATVTLRGENFGVAPRGIIQRIRIGGVDVAQFQVLSPTEISLIAGNVRTGRVEIDTPFGILTSNDDFVRYTTTFVYVPLIALKDSLALLAIYRATGGDNWTRRDNWLRTDVPVTSWFGVRVVAGRVVEVRLPNNNLRGVLTEAVQDLDSIAVLDLSNNQLSGDIRTLFCPLRRLREWNIAGNNFTGRLPECWGNFTNLTMLNLSNNKLSDTLPIALGQLTNLTTLNLANNRFVGTLPSAWGVESAQILASGKINHSETNALTGLQRLNLSNNGLSGAVPVSWASLRSLRELNLSNNALTELPDFTRQVRLDSLLVGGNSMSIPSLTANASTRAAEAGGFVYLPQRHTFSATQATTARLDESFTLRIAEIPAIIQHTDNRYEWRKNGVTVRSTNADVSLTIATVQTSDAGEYRCMLTNTRLPGLSVESFPIILTTTQNTFSTLPNALNLISPSENAVDVATTASLVWWRVANAARYELQITSTATFVNATPFFAEQRNDAASTGQALEQVSTGTLSPLVFLQAYQWRVRGINSRGAGAWSSTGTFTTVSPNAVLAVSRVQFGAVPRLDTGLSRITIRNTSTFPLVLEQVTADSSDFSFSSAASIRLQTNEELSIGAMFRPRGVGVVQSPVRIRYRVEASNGQFSMPQTQSFAQRLEGTGLGLKVIAPFFDTVLVGQTRVASALVVNRATVRALLNSIVLTSQNDAYNFASELDRNGIDIGVDDTVSVLVKCTSLVPPSVGVVSLLGGTAAYTAILAETPPRREQAITPLTAYTRLRRVNDPIARVAVRASTRNLAPGSRFTLDVVLDSANTPALIQNGATRFAATLRYNKNVITLAPSEKGARIIRNTVPNNVLERIALTPTNWDGRTTLLAQVQCLAVAGNVDTSLVEIEDVRWTGASLEEFRRDTVRLNVCVAGGKRLVTSAKAAALSVVAPNPAKDALHLVYTVREDSFVTLELVDMHGKVAKTLVSEEQAAGEYSLEATLKNILSGAYTVRLQTAGMVFSRQVNVVR